MTHRVQEPTGASSRPAHPHQDLCVPYSWDTTLSPSMAGASLWGRLGLPRSRGSSRARPRGGTHCAHRPLASAAAREEGRGQDLHVGLFGGDILRERKHFSNVFFFLKKPTTNPVYFK